MDTSFMRLALGEAETAYAKGEVPVGAVVVLRKKILYSAHNLCKRDSDPTAHAEMLAIREAAKLNGGRLDGATLYVTLEPCAMCAGAAIHARLARIVFGAFDELAGCCSSLAELTDGWLGRSIPLTGGILEDECARLLSEFFAQRRQNKKC